MMKQTAKKIFYGIWHAFTGCLFGAVVMLAIALFVGIAAMNANAFTSFVVLINISGIAIFMGGSIGAVYFVLRFLRVNRKRQILALLPLTLFWLYCLHDSLTGPEFHIQNLTYMAHEKIHEGRDRHYKSLVAMGENAVPAIIRTLRRESPWTRDTVSLVGVLADIGKPAHKLLLEEIEKERDPQTRIYLIHTLQSAFNDFRYLPYWLDLLRNSQLTYTSRYLNQQLYDFTSKNLESPIIQEALDSMPEEQGLPTVFVKAYSDKPQPISPFFIRWYRAMSKPDGPFPAWDFANTSK